MEFQEKLILRFTDLYASASVNDFGAFKIDAHIVKQIASILKAKYFGECETFFLLSVMLNF